MRLIRSGSLLAFITCLAFAAAAAVDDAKRIEELMRKSGMWEQVAATRDQVKGGVRDAWEEQKKQGRSGLGALDVSLLEAAVDKAFAADTMRRTVATELGRQMDPKDVDEVLKWLDTDAGRKITRLEEEASRIDEPAKTEKEARELAAKIPRERLAMFERLIAALRMDETNVDTTINMVSAIVYAVAAVTPQGDPEEAVRKLRQGYEPQRKQMEAYYHQLTLASMGRSYKTVSDAELERYVKFNETPAGKRYNDASTQAFARALVQGCLDLGRELGRDAQSPPIKS